jgi:class 3 adenylate cyclase
MRTKPFGTLLGSGHPPDRVAGFYKLKNAPWTMLIYAPGDEILAPIVKFRSYYIAGGILFILIILLLIRFVVGKMVRSITEISRMAGRVAKGNYEDTLSIESKDEIGQLARSFNTMIRGLRERDFIRNTFGRYVDQEIAKELLTRPEAAKLGGEKREVAILMSDIRGFTRISESLSPEATISVLNHYFSHLVEMTKKHKGIIVDFFGDGVLVFFDPFKDPIEPAVERAVNCAFEIQDTMVKFNEEMKGEGFPEFQTGIGVNVGEVVVGNIGSETRAKYGIVGSPVNVTHRIQSTANGGDVVISESVYGYISTGIKVKRSFEASLKGLEEETKLYVVELSE